MRNFLNLVLVLFLLSGSIQIAAAQSNNVIANNVMFNFTRVELLGISDAFNGSYKIKVSNVNKNGHSNAIYLTGSIHERAKDCLDLIGKYTPHMLSGEGYIGIIRFNGALDSGSISSSTPIGIGHTLNNYINVIVKGCQIEAVNQTGGRS